MANHWQQRSVTYAPFALALTSLFVIGWAAWRLSTFPYDGAEWSSLTGEVAQVDFIRRGIR